MFEFSRDRLQEIAQFALDQSRRVGASDASVDLSESSGLSVNVRLGRVETIEQNRDKGLGVTVHLGQRRGHASTSDFGEQAIVDAVRAAWEIARHTGEDDCAGLPDEPTLYRGGHDESLDLFHPWNPQADEAVALATRIERAALDTSALVKNSDGAWVSASQGHFYMANTAGFGGGYPYSRHSYGCAPIAQRGQSMQRDDWYSAAVSRERLADPDKLGRYAAQRALSRLGARRIATGRFPVLFEAPVACGLLGHFVQAVSGSALYRKTSFLVESLGKEVWSNHIDIWDDPFLPAHSGSAFFDSEGVATARRQVVRGGRLEGYFLSTYSARKLGMQTTGNAGGSHNLHLTSRLTRQLDDLPAMLERLGTGLFVTDLMGQGVNYLTGDYSRGASGFWVEGGTIVHPVEEITIAGHLAQMLRDVVAVGSDVITRGTKTCGSVLIGAMSVAGN